MKKGESALLGARVKSLELELKILKAKLNQTREKSESFASLYGLLRGKSDSTYEEIQEAEYQLTESLK